MSLYLVKNMDNIFVSRQLEKTLQSWLPRKESLLIYGVRQAGKSTLLKRFYSQFPRAKYFSLDEAETLHQLQNNPQGILEQAIIFSNHVFIDEFQKIPGLTMVIKYLIDNKQTPKFFLSGSISDVLTKGGDSLVGRAIRFPLYTFSFQEYLSAKGLKIDFQPELANIKPADWQGLLLEKTKILQTEINDYLQNGGYPATVNMDNQQRQSFFETIKKSLPEKDLLTILRSGQGNNLSHLAVILAKRVGSPLSLNGLAMELGIDLKTVKKLIDILQYSFWVEVIYAKAEYGSEFKNKFKVYFLDNGLRNFLAQISEIGDFEAGAVFENCAFGIIKRDLSYKQNYTEIKFWHTYGGGEVDFLIKDGREEIAVEVKSGRLLQTSVPLSLINFIKRYHPQKALVLNRDFFGETKIEKTPVYFIPLYVFALLV